MKKIGLIILIWTLVVFAKKEELKFFLDYCCFEKDNHTLAEIYLSIPQNCLTYDSLKKQARFKIELSVFDNDSLISKKAWIQVHNVASVADAKSIYKEVPAQDRFLLKPKSYKFVAEITDLISGEKENISLSQNSNLFRVKDLKSSGLMISDLQFVSDFRARENMNQSEFYKNSQIVIPNPRRLYGLHLPILKYYAEVYNVEKDQELYFSYSIADSRGADKYLSQEKLIKAKTSPMIIAAQTKAIAELKTGSYRFYLKLRDKQGNEYLKGSDFYIVNDLGINDERVINDLEDYQEQLKMMSQDKVENEVKIIYSIMPENEQRIIDKLNKNAYRNYLLDYWQEREKKVKGIRKNFLYYVDKANQSYGLQKKKGWDTDRGRILIRFGKPDRKEVVTLESNMLDHEIWTYDDGNYIFVFADLHNLNDYKLIHSNYPGEKSNANWQKKVTKMKK